jgi:hypothetical protein
MTPHRVERATLAAGVLLLHLLLWSAWPRQPARERGVPSAAAAQAPLSVRLLLPQPVPAQRTEPRTATAADRSATPRRTRPQQTLAITAPPELGPAAAPPAPAVSAPRELDLRWPSSVASPRSPSLREQWLNDPRSNTPRASVEPRVAAVAGSSAMTEERMDDTKTRFRQNGECIEVHVSRDAQINAWNQNHSPTPKIVKPSC